MQAEEELKTNLKNNFNYYIKEGKFNGTFEKFVDEFNKATKRYANEYRKLKPITILQKYGRDAAIALGEQQWTDVGWNLMKLKKMLDSKEAERLYFTPI